MRFAGSSFALVVAVAALFAGCAAEPKDEQARELTPTDFAGSPATQPATNPAAPANRVRLGASDGYNGFEPRDRSERELERTLDKLPQPVVVAGAPAPPTTKPSGPVYTLDAMVGQVNGQAIYANTVFEPIAEQLGVLGGREPRMVFRQRAKEIISQRLSEMVFDLLILGEAERDLSTQEQAGLQNMLKERREELIKFWGTGSEAVANEKLREKKGKTVDQMMTESRQTAIVRRYMQQKLLPKINVTRKDIERYYYDHIKEYDPPPTRTLRVIRVESAANADKIEAMLAEGTPFIKAAGNRLNTYKPAEQGVLIDASADPKVFGPDALNDALARLKPGEQSPRIKIGESYWWVCFESTTAGKSQSLREAQIDIEEILRRQRFQALSIRYRQRLFAQGSYNPIDQMSDSLLQVAMSRYALPE